MKRLLIFLAITLSFLVACTQEQDESPTVEDEYAVYSALLEYIHSEGTTVIIIDEKADLDKDFLSKEFTEICVWKFLTKLNYEGWDDYIAIAEKNINDLFNLSGIEVILISNDELRSIFDNTETSIEGWTNFYEKYPEGLPWGYTWLSEVAFHPIRKEAIVYAGWLGDSLAGSGDYFYLKYIYGKWRVVGVAPVWQS